jgi:hypothetical protein
MPRRSKTNKETRTQKSPSEESERDTTEELSPENLEMQDSIDKVLESWPANTKFIWEIDGEELLCEAWMLKQLVSEGTIPRDMLKSIIATGDQKIEVVEDQKGKLVQWDDSKPSGSGTAPGSK